MLRACTACHLTVTHRTNQGCIYIGYFTPEERVCASSTTPVQGSQAQPAPEARPKMLTEMSQQLQQGGFRTGGPALGAGVW